MKILLIDVYFYNKGGAETVCFNTGELLTEKGHDVCYFTLKWKENNPYTYDKYFPESKESRKGAFKYFQNLVAYFYHREAANKIRLLIEKEKPDIAHIHLMWGQISPSIFPVLKKFNIPIVFTAHDYRMICPAYAFKNGKGEICEKCQGKKFYKCFTNRCTKGSYILSLIMASEQYFRNMFFNPSEYIDGFIFVSDFSKQKHIQYMPKLLQKKNITLHNFTFKPREKTNEKSNEKYFLYFGRLSEEKGIKNLFNTFKELPSIKLKIVGSGPLEEMLIAQKHSLNIDNIELLGYKTGFELETLIKNSYFVIVPSECYENNPMSIIESYTLSIPVIGANIGGIPEIIEDNRTGFLFSSGSQIELKSTINKANALTDEEYYKICRCVIKYATNNISSEIYYKKLINFYENIIEDKK